MSRQAETDDAQHPGNSIQETHDHKKMGKLSDGEKASCAISTAARKAMQDALAADINAYIATHEDFVADLAKKYDKKVPYIHGLVTSSSHFVQLREPTLCNTLIHQMSWEAKDDKRHPNFYNGKTLVLADLQKLTGLWLITEEFSAAEKTTLIDALKEHRRHKAKGLRATNIAATIDSRSVAANVQDKAKKPEKNDLRALHKEVKELLDDMLRKFIHDDTARMVYVHFTVDVALLWKVKLMCWPTHIKFANASRIGTIYNLHEIRDKVCTGVTHLKALNLEAEVKALRKKQDGKRKWRAAGSDIGKTHVSAVCNDRGDCKGNLSSVREHEN
ncbi:hypothetical protein K438DRAFT_1971767 [Mycena galopus ATCC 62051]|nr:hypothetical protein K438DRAFT_1971767 [Mycena galopus ATCC 62051]